MNGITHDFRADVMKKTNSELAGETREQGTGNREQEWRLARGL
jgi:hypothetical protein